MKEIICDFCGGTEMVHGVQTGYASITKIKGWRGQSLYHDICANCGTVVRSFVEHPEKLR